MKNGGGLAGHNGLRSIKAHLHSDAFLRVRIGVGKPVSKEHGVDHVLKKFSKRERAEIDVTIEQAADAVECIVDRRRRRRHEPLQLKSAPDSLSRDGRFPDVERHWIIRPAVR